jgi:hypothetical protein
MLFHDKQCSTSASGVTNTLEAHCLVPAVARVINCGSCIFLLPLLVRLLLLLLLLLWHPAATGCVCSRCTPLWTLTRPSTAVHASLC